MSTSGAISFNLPIRLMPSASGRPISRKIRSMTEEEAVSRAPAPSAAVETLYPSFLTRPAREKRRSSMSSTMRTAPIRNRCERALIIIVSSRFLVPSPSFFLDQLFVINGSTFRLEKHHKGGSLSFCALNDYGCIIFPQGSVDYRKSEAGAGALGGEKWLKYLVDGLGGHAGPIV